MNRLSRYPIVAMFEKVQVLTYFINQSDIRFCRYHFSLPYHLAMLSNEELRTSQSIPKSSKNQIKMCHLISLVIEAIIRNCPYIVLSEYPTISNTLYTWTPSASVAQSSDTEPQTDTDGRKRFKMVSVAPIPLSHGQSVFFPKSGNFAIFIHN